MRIVLVACTFLFFIHQGIGASFDTLFIKPGIKSFGTSEVASLGFSDIDMFQNSPGLLHGTLHDTLFLTIVNHDVAYHRIQFSNFTLANDSIAPDAAQTLELPLQSIGIFDFYDDLNNGFNKYLGLNGVLEVGLEYPVFFWQLTEIDTSITNVNWNTSLPYHPQYFTINNLSAPQTMMDPIGRVEGAVGDTLLIAIVNHGLMKHAIHFHGYHCSIFYDSENPSRVGWEKETFPIDIGASMILKLVPDKPGDYPVHDHNLIAVLGAGEYVKGMMTMLQITD